MKRADDQRSPQETARMRDETLRRMTRTKPQTLKGQKEVLKEGRAGPKPGWPKQVP